VGFGFDDSLGLRATWWQFDHDAATTSANPPANGFGRVAAPPFGDVDISTTIPTDVLTATSGLNVYSIDLEITKQSEFDGWQLGATCGVRYASASQKYLAQTRDSGSDLLGQIGFRHWMDGVGPTLSLSGSVPLTSSWSLFGNGRGSLLFGRATSLLTAGEDLDLSTSFTTTNTNYRDDLLPIAELQLGLRWSGDARSRSRLRPFGTVAMEAQNWSGVGNAVSEDGSLGFFGFTSGLGASW
jgi:hypothetical protein